MKAAVWLLTVLALAITTSAHGELEFEEAKHIIDSKISCDELTEEQLEVVGDYYMEQMHPGELHEIMDERMGGEGSDTLRQAHISMARSFYCGEHDAMPAGMMNMMVGRIGMVGSASSLGQVGMGQGMMGLGTGYGWHWLGALYWILIIVAIVLLVWWLINKSKENQLTPLEILKERYAKGELTKSQFEKMKKELGD